jgi:hypothetical protein
MKRILILIFMLLSFAGFATNYYVKNGGNDANDGLTDATAWETTYRVDAKTLSAGDTVFFKRGDTFVSNAIIYPEAGGVGNSIVFAAYGIGAKPIITGFGSLPNWSIVGNWTNTTGNIWTFSTTNNTKRLWLDNTEVRYAADGTVDATDIFKWASNTLTVYSVGNPATTFSSIEACIYDYIFYCNYGNISFIDLDLQGSHNGIRIYGNGDNILIDSCNIGYNMDMRGIEAGASGTNSLDNIIIKDCNFISNDKINYIGYETQRTFAGVYLVYSASNVQIYNNYFENWGHSCIDFLVASTYTVNNIKIHDNFFTAPNIYYCRGLGVILNRGTATNIEIYNNVIFDCPVASTVIGENISLHHNIFNNNHRENIIIARPYITGSCLNIDYSGDVLLTNTKYYNNVFVNAYDCGIDFGAYNGAYPYQGLEITNNIFYNNGSSARSESYQLYIYDQTLMLGNTYKNNIFYKPGISDVIRYGNDETNDYPHTVAEFNAENETDGDTILNNLQSDPLFIDAANSDFKLQTLSPAINAGIDVGLDYLGDAPDIGAYEYVNPNPEVLADVTLSVINTASRAILVQGVAATDGGGTITERGIVYSTSANPTTVNGKVVNGSGLGSYTSLINLLTNSTTYYIRAYATNEAGTAYSNQLIIKTKYSSAFKTDGATYRYSGKYFKY